MTHYLLDTDREIQSGDDIDGPGESNLSWTIKILKDGTIEPPRQVLQLCPKIEPPRQVLQLCPKAERQANQAAFKAVPQK